MGGSGGEDGETVEVILLKSLRDGVKGFRMTVGGGLGLRGAFAGCLGRLTLNEALIGA